MELIFIYNANSGMLNGALDFAHKLISPKTYNCQLCALTYDHFGMKKSWKTFLAENNLTATFSHKDELLKSDYKDIAFNFPCILVKKNKNITLIYSAEEFQNTSSLDDLKEKLKIKLQRLS